MRRLVVAMVAQLWEYQVLWKVSMEMRIRLRTEIDYNDKRMQN